MTHLVTTQMVVQMAALACIAQQFNTANELRNDCVNLRQQLEAEELCDRLTEVRTLPFKGEHVDDLVYNRIVSLGTAAIPCLVRQVTNNTVTEDPRKAPKYRPVRVGDVAFWILLDIAKLPYEAMFPEQIRRRFKDEGVYAYFEFVKAGDNRRLLQKTIMSYLRSVTLSRE